MPVFPTVPGVPGRVGEDGRAWRPHFIKTAVLGVDARALESYYKWHLPAGPDVTRRARPLPTGPGRHPQGPTITYRARPSPAVTGRNLAHPTSLETCRARPSVPGSVLDGRQDARPSRASSHALPSVPSAPEDGRTGRLGSLLDAIAHILISEWSSQVVAIALQLDTDRQEIRLTIAENHDVPNALVTHLTNIWQMLQALSNVYAGRRPVELHDFQADSPGIPSEVGFPLKVAIFRHIYEYSREKLMRRINKWWDCLLDFQEELLNYHVVANLQEVKLNLCNTVLALQIALSLICDNPPNQLTYEEWEKVFSYSMLAAENAKLVLAYGEGFGCDDLAYALKGDPGRARLWFGKAAFQQPGPVAPEKAWVSPVLLKAGRTGRLGSQGLSPQKCSVLSTANVDPPSTSKLKTMMAGMISCHLGILASPNSATVAAGSGLKPSTIRADRNSILEAPWKIVFSMGDTHCRDSLKKLLVRKLLTEYRAHFVKVEKGLERSRSESGGASLSGASQKLSNRHSRRLKAGAAVRLQELGDNVLHLGTRLRRSHRPHSTTARCRTGE
ncbi:hypothetical protein HOY80DRAFT_1139578 [Tuber brumale]|nr:hypothetical protein HOY80DRAFT_1139578 [Tuber brumale]